MCCSVGAEEAPTCLSSWTLLSTAVLKTVTCSCLLTCHQPSTLPSLGRVLLLISQLIASSAPHAVSNGDRAAVRFGPFAGFVGFVVDADVV